MKIILASTSQRRKEIMDLAGFDYEILFGNIDESRNETLELEEQVKDLAYRKAKFVYDNTQGDRAIIGADTLVIKDNNIFGKPKNREEAIMMLRELQGGKHCVCTGIAVFIERKEKEREYNELHKTEIYVKAMSDTEIYQYIENNNPYDKAGSYAIQGQFQNFIERIDGSYANAVGLPIQRIYEILKENDFLE